MVLDLLEYAEWGRTELRDPFHRPPIRISNTVPSTVPQGPPDLDWLVRANLDKTET